MLAVVAILVFAALPAPADEHWSKVMKTLPLGPDTGTFHIGLTNTNPELHWCRQVVRDAHGFNNLSTQEYLYATNDPSDPCRATAPPNNSPHRRTLTASPGVAKSFIIYLVPVAKEIGFAEGGKITGTLHMFTTRVGTLQPTIELEDAAWNVVGTAWQADETDTKTDGLQDTPEGTTAPDGTQWHKFDFDLGAAPKNVSGPLHLNVTVRVSTEPAQAGWASGGDTGIGFTGDHAGTIVLPVLSAVMVGDEAPAQVTCPDGSFANNTTLCPVVTEGPPEESPTGSPGPNNTTDAPGGDGPTDTDEDEGIPGLGLVAVLAAIAIPAVVMRRRR